MTRVNSIIKALRGEYKLDYPVPAELLEKAQKQIAAEDFVPDESIHLSYWNQVVFIPKDGRVKKRHVTMCECWFKADGDRYYGMAMHTNKKIARYEAFVSAKPTHEIVSYSYEDVKSHSAKN